MKFNFNNKKVLILKLQGIGDTVLLIPMIKKIFEIYPEIKLDVALSNNGSAELLKLYNFPIRRIIGVNKDIKGYLKFILSMIVQRYYAIILPYKSGKKENLLSFLSLCKRRIGYVYKNLFSEYYNKIFDFFINYKLIVANFQQYNIMNLNLLKEISGINFRIEKKYPEINFSIKSKNIVNKFLKDNNIKKYIIFHLWAGDKDRLWSNENYKNLIKKIISKYKELNIILVGYGEEVEWNKKIAHSINKNKIIVFDDSTIENLLYLLKKTKLVVGNDSGVMHLSSLVNVKIFSIWAYTNYFNTSPFSCKTYIIRRDLKCSPCYKFFLPVKCIYNRKICLNISVEKVWKILKKIIDNKKIDYTLKLSSGALVINI